MPAASPAIDYHESFVIKDALQLAQRDVQQIANAAWQAFEKPDMRAGTGQLDMPEPLAPHARKRNFHAALIADNSAMLHALVFAAETFPVSNGTKNARAEQTVALRFKGAVVNGFRLRDFTV